MRSNRKRNNGKGQNPQQTQLPTALRPGLPSGWLGICHRNDKTSQRLQEHREQSDERQISLTREHPGAGFPKNMWLWEMKAAPANPTAEPHPLPLHLPGLTQVVKQAQDNPRNGLIPRPWAAVNCLPLDTGFRSQCQKVQDKAPCRRMSFSPS